MRWMLTTFFVSTESGRLEFEEFITLAAKFIVEEDAEAMQKELREAFRLYDKEGKDPQPPTGQCARYPTLPSMNYVAFPLRRHHVSLHPASAFNYVSLLCAGNGYIPTSCLKEILRELDDQLTEQELNMMIDEIDSDGSGTVDFDGQSQAPCGLPQTPAAIPRPAGPAGPPRQTPIARVAYVAGDFASSRTALRNACRTGRRAARSGVLRPCPRLPLRLRPGLERAAEPAESPTGRHVPVNTPTRCWPGRPLRQHRSAALARLAAVLTHFCRRAKRQALGFPVTRALCPQNHEQCRPGRANPGGGREGGLGPTRLYPQRVSVGLRHGTAPTERRAFETVSRRVGSFGGLWIATVSDKRPPRLGVLPLIVLGGLRVARVGRRRTAGPESTA